MDLSLRSRPFSLQRRQALAHWKRFIEKEPNSPEASVLLDGQISEVVELDANRSAIFKVTQRYEASRLPLADVRDEIEAAIRAQEAQTIIFNRAEQLLVALNDGEDFGAAAEAMRRILIENARQRSQPRRGGGRGRVPLEDADERRLLETFGSVTRATLKGTAVIGLLQGGLAGLAFAVVGIPSAVFWGTIMVVLSIIPGIGTGLIWVPAVVILVAGGSLVKGIVLALFCGLIVGSIDNVLRPRLVGKDTQMPDLLIFVGTLGGIVMFGILGFIIGPIVAALFITVWDIYGIAFKDVLPAAGPSGLSAERPSTSPKPEIPALPKADE